MTGLWRVLRTVAGVKSSMSGLFLRCVLVTTLIGNIYTDMFHIQQTTTQAQRPPNSVTTYNECKNYLCKYGYLQLKCKCSLAAMRHRRSLLDDLLSPTELEIDESSDALLKTRENISELPAGSASNSSQLPACAKNHFKQALLMFQKNYGLPETGVCDDKTRDKMSQRRCGQPDTVIDRLTGEEAAKTSMIREKRSLLELLQVETERNQAIEARKRQLAQYVQELKDEVIQPRQDTRGKREKKSVFNVNVSDDYGGPLGKNRVSWRLMTDHYSMMIPPERQRAILKQAFRYWSEVSPLCFYEDNLAQSVDIEIGFLEGIHLSCFRQFDGYGGEIAHKFYRDVHFDNSEPYSTDISQSVSSSFISLLLVATHELGHVIGLNHSVVDNSIMNALYHQSIKGDFELSSHDRAEVRNTYGPCSGRFDTAFDFVRYGNGGTSRIYNTYFFRSDHFWMYENNNARARYGDPLSLQPEWVGLPRDVDAFVHYFELRRKGHSFYVYDEYFFFKGTMYYIYDVTEDKVTEHGQITSKFRSTSLHSLPSGFDTAFYDNRDKYIYFFKGDKVYVYDYKPDGDHSCCVRVEDISSEFPPASQSDRRSSSNETYENNLDSIYFSYYRNSIYFIKGDDVWENKRYKLNGGQRQNSISYNGKWYDTWQFLCDGECS